jgi:hypothetical protein
MTIGILNVPLPAIVASKLVRIREVALRMESSSVAVDLLASLLWMI